MLAKVQQLDPLKNFCSIVAPQYVIAFDFRDVSLSYFILRLKQSICFLTVSVQLTSLTFLSKTTSYKPLRKGDQIDILISKSYVSDINFGANSSLISFLLFQKALISVLHPIFQRISSFQQYSELEALSMTEIESFCQANTLISMSNESYLKLRVGLAVYISKISKNYITSSHIIYLKCKKQQHKKDYKFSKILLAIVYRVAHMTIVFDIFLNFCKFLYLYNSSNKKSMSHNITISMPEIKSFRYENNVKQIQDLVGNINQFTNNFQVKLGNMLKGQETEFVNSYKAHMFAIQNTLKEYQKQIERYQKKIEQYENVGALSNLFKKVAFLEEKERKMLDKVEKNKLTILELKLDVQTRDKEILTMRKRIKQLLSKQNSRTSISIKQQQATFPTQIDHKNTLKSQQSCDLLDRSHFSTIHNPEERIFGLQEHSSRLSKQMENLKKKNRELSAFNSRIVQRASSVQNFFLRSIDELKRKVSIRKKFKQCSFQEFRQEDKLELLVKILSNDQILQHLYDKIFAKPITGRLSGLSTRLEDVAHIAKTQRIRKQSAKLPLISARAQKQ